MQKIFYVANDDLTEVNKELKKGATVERICAVSGCVSTIGEYSAPSAYVVLNMPDPGKSPQ